jgi:hypothetical protein
MQCDSHQHRSAAAAEKPMEVCRKRLAGGRQHKM